MSAQPEPYPDPLIDEVRRRRIGLFESLGGSLEKLFEEIQRLQREHPEKIVDLRAMMNKKGK